MTRMDESVTVETGAFECQEVKPHFINPCCFGEDFAGWLKQQISSLTDSGFTLSELIQEDYGWGFWATHGKDPFWVALSYVGDGPQEPPAQWVVTVAYDPGLSVIKRLFHKADAQAFAQLRDLVWKAIKANSTIRIVEMPKY